MVICDMGIVQSYLGNWGKRVNFGNGVAEILTKVWERKDKWCDGRREKIWILVILLLKFLLLEIPAQLPGEVLEGGVAERKPIMATKLLKL